jgi:hypothetical protein
MCTCREGEGGGEGGEEDSFHMHGIFL